MLKNYLTLAWRTIVKNKLVSAINIFGLGFGLAICFLILLYVQYELTYDRYNLNSDRIYRINSSHSFNGSREESAYTPPVLAAQLKSDYPEIQQIVQISYIGNPWFTREGKRIDGQNVYGIQGA